MPAENEASEPIGAHSGAGQTGRPKNHATKLDKKASPSNTTTGQTSRCELGSNRRSGTKSSAYASKRGAPTEVGGRAARPNLSRNTRARRGTRRSRKAETSSGGSDSANVSTSGNLGVDTSKLGIDGDVVDNKKRKLRHGRGRAKGKFTLDSKSRSNREFVTKRVTRAR